jgi:hypothetical protein
MIQRFEDEYPECRPPGVTPCDDPPESTTIERHASESSSSHSSSSPTRTPSTSTLPGSSTSTKSGRSTDANGGSEWYSDDEDDVHPTQRLRSRHASDVSLAAKALSIEEGRVHRIGTKVKRDLLAEGNGQWPGEDRIESEIREKLAQFEGEPGGERLQAERERIESETNQA